LGFQKSLSPKIILKYAKGSFRGKAFANMESRGASIKMAKKAKTMTASRCAFLIRIPRGIACHLEKARLVP
jgi:hypothetical protein